ncbi:MAG: ATP-binding cassette domain-containing protein [Steroidobacteraceae bacterium]|nr:ATP-binding cassette domain-containing protein [Steroidobacteraceae bacterium]
MSAPVAEVAASVALESIHVRRGAVLALEDVTGEFAAGSLTALVGPNGAGKSTLLETLTGRLQPVRGRVRCPVPRPEIAYLPQLARIDLRVPVTVADFVALGDWCRVGALRGIPERLRQATVEALHQTGLEALAARRLAELSAGQLQRARFAQLLMRSPRLMLLDEPFAGMDEETTTRLVALIRGWHRGGLTLVVVLHDRELARELCPRTLLLDRRVLAWGPTEATIAHHRWRHVA